MKPATPCTRHVAIAATVLLAVFSVWLLGGWTQGAARTAIDDVVLVAVSMVALVFAVLAAVGSTGRMRTAWSYLAAALGAWTAAEIIWSVDEVMLRETPFPSVADMFFLLFPVGAAIALLLFRSPRVNRTRGLVLLDGLVVAGSLFIVLWLLVMGPLYEQGATRPLEFIVLLAYPVMDLILVTIATVVLVGAGPGHRLALTLITAAMIFIALADSGYAYLSLKGQYSSGAFVDIGWVAGLLLLAVAATIGPEDGVADKAGPDAPGLASVWLPYAPLMLAGVVLAANPPVETFVRPVIVAGVLLFGAVLARQFLAVRENRRLLAAVADQALRDPLTGLANRALFHDRLNHALQMRERTGAAVGVLLLDLDEFKLVNDTLGHPAGDEVLKRAGERVAASVHPGDTVARLGGDEFGVMTQGDPVLTEMVAHRIVDAFDEPITIDGRDLQMRPSIGLAVAPADQTGLTGEELLHHADMAMYASKRSRSQSAQTFSAQIPMAETESFGLLREFRRALDTDELVLVYQPKFRLDNGAMAGVEALLRWRHPERGILGPEEFLPVVRRYGLIEPVTAYVVDTAMDDAARWRAEGHDIPVAVNLFPPSLAVADLPERLGDALRERGLPASALTVEITEDVLLDDIDRVRAVLLELRERGIRISIDDFGSGYSALWYLRDLPVDQIKLDRGFIAPIIDDPRAAVVARAVIDLAHALCMDTVAEGVEDPATADWLRRYGCDEVQGYYFSSPLRAAEVTTLRARAAARSN